MVMFEFSGHELLVMSMYDSMVGEIDEVCRELGLPYSIFDCQDITEELPERLNAYFRIHRQPDVIISRGGIVEYLQKEFPNIVVLRAEPDDVNIIEALYKAKEHGPDIGLLVYKENAFYAKEAFLCNALGLCSIKIYPFESREDIVNQIARAQREGKSAIAGGGTVGQEVGGKIGFPVVFIETSKRAVRNVVTQAISIIESRREENSQLDNLNMVLRSVQEGIIAIRNNVIQLVNPEFEKIFRTGAHALHGKRVSEIKESSQVMKELKALILSKDQVEKITQEKNNSYLLRKIVLSGKKSLHEMMVIVQHAEDIQNQELLIRASLHEKGTRAKYSFSDIVGSCPSITAATAKAKTFARVDANILISGESGTGKELFAQSIHNASERKNRPFVAVNCAAIPESLLESELFGYEEGAFSGAKKGGKIGFFEVAHEGTLFLDEINSIPVHIQGVLLRAIQEREIWRVGSHSSTAVNIRIISATNQGILNLIESGQFRSDLYFRLNTLSLRIPSLNERATDIPLYVDHFLKMFCAQYGLPRKKMDKNDLRYLTERQWRGNIRELQNIIHRYVILGTENDCDIRQCLEDDDGPAAAQGKGGGVDLSVRRDTLPEMEFQLIERLLGENRWNYQTTADKLGISRTTLWRKLKNRREIRQGANRPHET